MMGQEAELQARRQAWIEAVRKPELDEQRQKQGY
jgi:hypothetical protein